MRTFKVASLFRSLLALAFLFVAHPAQARITVVDGGQTIAIDGYCTPGTASGPDCAPQALPFAITIGGTTYDSFILNGNGMLTLGNAAIDWNSVSNSPPNLAGFTMPVFSPETDNAIFARPDLLGSFGDEDIDTRWAASVSTVPNTSLTAYWFRCSTAIFCGTQSLDASLYDGSLTIDQVRERQVWGMFGLTLTDLGSGFQLDYFYYPVGDPPIGDTTGFYGFNLPGTASLQTTGPLVNRSWVFDELGHVASVPEPATWLTMLVGLAGMGLVLRRQRNWAPSYA